MLLEIVMEFNIYGKVEFISNNLKMIKGDYYGRLENGSRN